MKSRKIVALAASLLFTLSVPAVQAAEPQAVVPQDGILTNGKNVLEILHQLAA